MYKDLERLKKKFFDGFTTFISIINFNCTYTFIVFSNILVNPLILKCQRLQSKLYYVGIHLLKVTFIKKSIYHYYYVFIQRILVLIGKSNTTHFF